MSYSTANSSGHDDLTKRENHVVLTIVVYDIKGKFVERCTRILMVDGPTRYVTYRKKRYQLKKLKEFVTYETPSGAKKIEYKIVVQPI